MKSAPAETPPARAGAAPAPRPWALALVALIVLAAALKLVNRSERPIEQGGDAYSDGNALIAGKHFAEQGFAKLYFLPAIYPAIGPFPPTPPFYTHYPPGPDLMNGFLRTLGLTTLSSFRMVSAAFSLAGLVLWFLALQALFGDGIALAGLAAYAMLYPFVWLADSIHHYGYSEFFRIAALYLTVRAATRRPGALETAVLCAVLLAQSIFAFDFILYSQIVLLGLGVTAWRGERLGRLLLFGAMPVLGFGLHLAQNAWALGMHAALDDMKNSFLQRAFASGDFHFHPYTRWEMVRNVVERTNIYFGIGFGPMSALGAIGAAGWAHCAPEAKRWLAARVLGVLAVATSAWFVIMYDHCAEHEFVVRQALPLAALSVALGLHGIFAVAAEHSRRLGCALVVMASFFLTADALLPYGRDEVQRTQFSAKFSVAYAFARALPPDRPVTTNINTSSPALAALLYRPVFVATDYASLCSHYGKGSKAIYLLSHHSAIATDLEARLGRARTIAQNESGALIEIEIE